MSASVVFVRVHDEDAVREIIATAYTIATDTADSHTAFVPVFEKAVDLLSARVPLQQMPASAGFPLVLPDLRG